MAVRQGTLADLGWVKAMADQHRREVGFILRPALRDAIARGELLVVAGMAFCRWHRRRDGWTVVYEIVSEQPGCGRALLSQLQRPLRLKCPADLAANGFYEHMTGTLACTEPGKRRRLNVWQWT